ncbi:MAG TPA: hypothetical protein VLF66_13745, partial [Thermoanaerobaculia bacterium]|nr:hypothetical protein [Thermoanaerobaculia bacterium]
SKLEIAVRTAGGAASVLSAELLLDRAMWREVTDAALGNVSRSWKLVRRGDQAGAREAAAALGPWVVVKPRRNLPWWHRNRARVVIAHCGFHFLWKRAMSLIEREEVIIEQLEESRLDGGGSTGEFRSFLFLSLNQRRTNR